jgi:hypothetical protein
VRQQKQATFLQLQWHSFIHSIFVHMIYIWHKPPQDIEHVNLHIYTRKTDNWPFCKMSPLIFLHLMHKICLSSVVRKVYCDRGTHRYLYILYIWFTDNMYNSYLLCLLTYQLWCKAVPHILKTVCISCFYKDLIFFLHGGSGM